MVAESGWRNKEGRSTTRALVSRGNLTTWLDDACFRMAGRDMTLPLASPYGALKRGKLAANAAEIAEIARKEGAGGLVLGLPLGKDGSFGPTAQATKDWGMAIARAAGLPVAMQDERLFSAAVNHPMIEADGARVRRRASAADTAPAAYMLQAALDTTAALPRLSSSPASGR
ncbi:MAG TPA: Holliday junction resolvase RuvX [Accumulibacter sp.]|nr:Holliday junction resolvase RuvX [Accumulibacter sp.]